MTGAVFHLNSVKAIRLYASACSRWVEKAPLCSALPGELEGVTPSPWGWLGPPGSSLPSAPPPLHISFPRALLSLPHTTKSPPNDFPFLEQRKLPPRWSQQRCQLISKSFAKKRSQDNPRERSWDDLAWLTALSWVPVV